jgi:phage protein D
MAGSVTARVAGGAEVKLAGAKVDEKAFHGFIVDMDLDQPDMCTLVLNNTSDFSYSAKTNQGDTLEVKIGPDSGGAGTIFSGEVVGVEPVFDAGGESRVTIRAFNRLHRLTRGRKSRTFEKMTAKDIVSKVASDHGLSPKITGDVNIKHDHVYQANLTDFELLLRLGARIDYEVFVEDKSLYFRKRDVGQDSGIKIEMDTAKEYALQKFAPRLSSAGLVQEVNVRSYNPDKKEEILGKATSPASKLGAKDGPGAAESPFGKVFYYDVDVPLKSVEEANAMAKAKLEELSLNYIVGDGVLFGHPKIKAGIVVNIDCKDERFNGKYYITGCSHRYTHEHKGGGKGGYLTAFKVRRNAAEK